MEQNIPKSSSGVWLKIFLIILIIGGFVSAFLGGIFLQKELFSGKNPSSQISPTPVISLTLPSPEITSESIPQDTTRFLPGKFYFDDSLLFVTQEEKPRIIIVTAVRLQDTNGYTQNSRASYFNGSSWVRKTDAKAISDSAIVSDSLIKKWVDIVDPSRVLKEKLQGEITINNQKISFLTNTLDNEISMRSLPGYTKFMSEGSGTISIDGQEIPAHVVLSRIYSLNAQDIQFYDTPFGLTTHWIVFWDTEGNFYHIDTTSVDKPTSKYQTHKIAVRESSDKILKKTFDVQINTDTQNPPVSYSVTMGAPISQTLTFKRVNEINKSPGSYTWVMGELSGEGATSGVGVAEYIHN